MNKTKRTQTDERPTDKWEVWHPPGNGPMVRRLRVEDGWLYQVGARMDMTWSNPVYVPKAEEEP